MSYVSYGYEDITEPKEKKVKSTVLELSLDPRYTQFDIAAAFREVLQNAMDEADLGNRMEVTRGSKIRGKLPEGHVDPISIISYGASMGRECLLMGGTSKRGVIKCRHCNYEDDYTNSSRTTCWECEEKLPKFRGKHGEGFKVACLVFLRNGYTVRIRVNSEIWTFFLEASKNFGGSELLKVRITAAQEVDFVAFEIGGVSNEVWKDATSLCLAINPPEKNEYIDVGGGNLILTSDKFRRHVFSQGLHVAEVSSLHYGYDLKDLKLDRDRKTADYWSQRECISSVLAEAVKTEALRAEDIMSLPDDCDEQDALHYNYNNRSTPDEFVEALTEWFTDKYGEDAVAVSSDAEALQAGQLGFRGITLPRGLRSVVNVKLGDFSKKAKKKELDASHIWTRDELTPEEQSNLKWATDLLSLVEGWLTAEKVQVVTYHGENVLGTFLDAHVDLDEDGEDAIIAERVRLAKRIVANRAELFSVYIHEVAHKYGPDGSDSHRRAIERISAELISIFIP